MFCSIRYFPNSGNSTNDPWEEPRLMMSVEFLPHISRSASNAAVESIPPLHRTRIFCFLAMASSRILCAVSSISSLISVLGETISGIGSMMLYLKPVTKVCVLSIEPVSKNFTKLT